MLETKIGGADIGGTGSAVREKIDPISLMIARFAASVERGAGADGGLVDLETSATLQFLFTTLAATQLHEFDFPLSQDPTNYPGHLIGHFEGRTVYIPFQLAEGIPSGETLQYLVQQADAVRIFTDSTICLSGSATFGLQFASDIDFCEYVSHTGKRVAQSFLAKGEANIPFCIEIRHGKNELERPWTQDEILDLCATDSGRIGGKCTCPGRDWKFDYVGRYEPTGVISISNLCIHEDDAEALSWSFQEIAITEKPQPIRYLVVPADLGRYVLWLRVQIDKHQEERPDKALKRAVSLARILRLNLLSERLLAMAKSPEFANHCRTTIIDKLRATVARLPEDVKMLLNDSGNVTASGEPNEKSAEFRIEDCYALLDETIRMYNDLMSCARELCGA
jgi:hypothetical protein